MDVDDMFMVNAVRQHLPYKRHRASKGWESFNCVMCQHNGEPTPDNRGRGGIIFSGPSFTYRCFRCGFKAHWRPGMRLTAKVKQLMEVLLIDTKTLFDLGIQAMQLQQLVKIDTSKHEHVHVSDFKTVELPPESKEIMALLENGCTEPKFLRALDYLSTRGQHVLNSSEFYWCNSKENGFEDRIIVPFYYDGEIVGWTARYAGNAADDVLKYYSEQQRGYIFNNHYLDDYYREYVVATEGTFDALSINGIGYLSNVPNDYQVDWMNRSGKKIILLSDRVKTGNKYRFNKEDPAIEVAIQNDWYVTFPTWDDDIKDVNEAVVRYGPLYVVNDLLQNKEDNEMRITMLLRKQ